MMGKEERIEYTDKTDTVDWIALKQAYIASDWDAGRSPEALASAFKGSYAAGFCRIGADCIGTVRAISDGCDAAAVFDLWVDPRYRRRGIGRTLMENLLAKLQGQYVLLSTDVTGFYSRLGFTETHAMAKKIHGVDGSL